MDYASYSRPRA